MPCDSSYMEPTAAERQRKQAAKLLLYVYEKMKHKPIPKWLKTAAKDVYGKGGEKAMPILCKYLRNLETNNLLTFDKLMFNGREKLSRQLADWWEEHQEQDKRKEN